MKSKIKYTPFREAVRRAEKDDVLCLITSAIVAANEAGTPDSLAYHAFADRCEEIGLAIRPGQITFLRSAVATYLKTIYWAARKAALSF